MSKKIKEPIRLRKKKMKNGGYSLYLDTYLNGRRKYEYLKLYINPETTPLDKRTNEETLKLANAVKAKRIVDLQEGRFGFERQVKPADITLREAVNIWDSVDVKESSIDTIKSNLGSLFEYDRRKVVKLTDITEEWVRGYRAWLIGRKEIKQNTKASQFAYFKITLNHLARRGYIEKSPAEKVENIPTEETERVFLTIEEVRKLANTPCKYEDIKRAFLFSCFTGLRFSDVSRLKWGDVTHSPNGMARITFRQKKTGGFEYLDINRDATALLGERKDDKELVYTLPKRRTVSLYVSRWAIESNINKHVTFHVARHTFATLVLSQGVNLYTVSKLLGHKSIKTTERYARVLDKAKQDAVNSLPGLFEE